MSCRWLLSIALALLAVAAPASETTAGAAREGNAAGDQAMPGAELAPREFARLLLEETNRARRAHGRRALKPRRELEAAADDQAAFMALRMQVQHGSFLPGQGSATDRVRRHGIYAGAVAENVASTTVFGVPAEFSARVIAARLVEQWLESPGHRATLLSRDVTHFGGSVRLARLGSQWTAYGVQVFLSSGPPFGRVSA